MGGHHSVRTSLRHQPARGGDAAVRGFRGSALPGSSRPRSSGSRSAERSSAPPRARKARTSARVGQLAIAARGSLRASAGSLCDGFDRRGQQRGAFVEQPCCRHEQARCQAGALQGMLCHDPARIEFGSHEMHGDAKGRCFMQQRLEYGINAFGLGQEGRMDIQAAERRERERRGVQTLIEKRADQQIGFASREKL